MKINLLRISFIFMLSLAGCSDKPTLPYYHTADFTPIWAMEQNVNVDTLHRISKFNFTDQHNQAVTNDTFKGKVYVANFFFTVCPGICPKMTHHLMKVATAFKEDDRFAIISHSVTPRIDSVSQLNQYAIENNINYDHWKLVTGNQGQIYKLARQSYFAEEEIGLNKQNEFLHTEHFILVDQQGHIRGLYNGTLELEADRLIDDIHILLNE